MLNKLLKYDLKWTYKVIIVFVILSIFFSCLARLFFEIDDNSTILYIFGQIWQGIAISMMVSTLVNGFIRNWVRLKNNLYGDEAYLTHTLPVKIGKIYLSKFLTAIIAMIIAVINILICVLIMYYSEGFIEFLKSGLKSIAEVYDSTVIELFIVVFIVFFLEMFSVVLAGYTGIIIGHRFNDNKFTKSIIFGFICYMVMQIFTILSLFILGLFNADVMNLFTSTSSGNANSIKTIMYGAIVLYTVYVMVYYMLNKKLLENGVNVD